MIMDDLKSNPLHGQDGGGFWGSEIVDQQYHFNKKLDPDVLVRAIGGKAFEALLGPLPEPVPTKPTKPPTRRKLAPLSKRLIPSKGTIVVLTGRDAWVRGLSPSIWFSGARLILPFGEDPAEFAWPVQGRYCLLYGFGKPERRERG